MNSAYKWDTRPVEKVGAGRVLESFGECVHLLLIKLQEQIITQ